MVKPLFPSGARGRRSIRIPGCIVGTLADDRIIRMQESVDSAHAAPLIAAMEEGGLPGGASRA